MSCWPTTEEESRTSTCACATNLRVPPDVGAEGKVNMWKGKQTGDLTEEASVGGKVY